MNTTPSVHAWMPDHGGGAYYRTYQPMKHLHGQGWAATWGIYLPPVRTDILLGQLTSRTPNTVKWRRMRETMGTKLIIDLDDDVWNISADNPARAYWTPTHTGNLSENMARSHHVIVSTPVLAEVARQHTDAPVSVCPNGVPDWLVDRGPGPSGRPIVTWAGSATHNADWDQFFPGLAAVIEEHDGVFHSYGALPPYGLFPARILRHQPWVMNPTDYLRSLRGDVVLAPLVGSVFNESKSELRLLEAAAIGAGIVASNVGPYARWVRHGVDGFLVDRPTDWAVYTRALLADRGLRERMGAAARDRVRAESVVSVTSQCWARVFLEAVGNG